jgi:hypothetical protein
MRYITAAQECGFHAVLFARCEKSYPAIMEAIHEKDNGEGTLCAEDITQTIK